MQTVPRVRRQQHQGRRGPRNALHDAAECCSEQLAEAVLLRGRMDVNQGDAKGCTPLFIASLNGGTGVARMLLKRGASVTIAAEGDVTPLHVSAQEGHLDVQKMLVKAGANVDAPTISGRTPLDMAAGRGHSEIIASLIEAGANVNSRLYDRATPLFRAAFCGHVGAVRELLRGKANPLLARVNELGDTCVPLDVAAQNGHTEVVRELIQQVGLKGCGGESGGMNALHMASGHEHIDIMAILTGAGVVDTGVALVVAAETGKEASVRFLLQQRQGKSTSNAARTYVNNTVGAHGVTPLAACINFAKSSSPRIVRLLVEAGADTTSAAMVMNPFGIFMKGMTPVNRVEFLVRERRLGDGEEATEKQLLSLEAIRRSLLRVDAVHAVSWLWPRDASKSYALRGAGSTIRTETVPKSTRMSLRSTLPVRRRTAERRGVFLAALFRSVAE